MDLITEEDSRTRKAFFDIHEVRASDQTTSFSHRNCHSGRSVVPGHIVHGGLYGGTKVFFSSPPLISNRHLAHTLTYLGEGRDLLISNAATDRHDCTQHHRRPSPLFASPDLRKSTMGGPDFNTAPIITRRRLKNAEISGYDASSHYGSLTGITFAEVKSS